MKFNFPEQEEGVLVTTRFTVPLFEKIKSIAEKEECLRSEVILTLLEAAVEEYLQDTKQKPLTAYPFFGPEESIDEEKNPDAVRLGHKGGLKGGPARAKALTPERRKEIAENAVKARWSKS